MLPKGLSIYLAMPSMGTIPVATVRSLVNTLEACRTYDVPLEVAFCTGSLVHHARTVLANNFLASSANRLFWVDSDIVWTPLDFFKVVIHTLSHDCVVGVYPRRCDAGGYFIRFKSDDPPVDHDGLVPINGTGLGFACVTRKVMEQVAATKPELIVAGTKQKSIFRMDCDDVEERGEDYAFWADVQELGHTLYADCTINLGHVGHKVYQRQETDNGITRKPTQQ